MAPEIRPTDFRRCCISLKCEFSLSSAFDWPCDNVLLLLCGSGQAFLNFGCLGFEIGLQVDMIWAR